MLLDEIKTMSDEELGWAVSIISQEIASRKELADIPKKIDTLNRDYLAATGEVEGGEWLQPTGAHDAYPFDWVTTYKGKEWKSLIPANVWAPGESGWREVVPEPEVVEPTPENPTPTPAAPTYAAWVQPTGGHDAYGNGAMVTYDGKVWKSTSAGNVWAPGVYGWVVV